MRDTPTRRFRCPSCHAKNDMALDPEGQAQPKPGDFTICVDCGHLMVFGHDMWPRDPTPDEITEIAGDPKLLKYQRAIAAAKRRL